jgi:hypothetical protein
MRLIRYLAAAVLFGTLGIAEAQAADTGTHVRCKDGTMSPAGRGACSHHGGMVRNEGAPAPTKTTPASVDADENKKVAPRTSTTAAPTMVRCKDGTTSEQGRGACSHHGGVETRSTPTAVPGTGTSTAPAPATEKETRAHNPKSELGADPPATRTEGLPTARCKDGTLSHSKHHSGTCSGHGGVDRWLDGSQP